MPKQFLRADTFRYRRIGKNRPKLQKWRRPRGKHNKLRLKRIGHPVSPSIGYGTPKISRISPVVVNNFLELEALTNGSTVIISKRLGAKKKLELIKRAEEKKIKITNLRSKK